MNKKALFQTADGENFYTKNLAQNHAHTLADRSVKEIELEADTAEATKDIEVEGAEVLTESAPEKPAADAPTPVVKKAAPAKPKNTAPGKQKTAETKPAARKKPAAGSAPAQAAPAAETEAITNTEQ